MNGSDDPKSSKVLVLAATAGLVLLPLTVFADPTGAPSNVQAATENVLETVVVTATKRESDVQSTPISITAVTSDDIASRGIADFDTLAKSVPGLAMRVSGGAGQTELEMRGLNSQGGNSSTVGFYLGEIPISSPTFSNLGKTIINPDLYDLSRVEVLKGPQGTLYGSSSMGGTVRLIPNAPQLNTFAVSAEEVFSDTISGGSINNSVNAMLNLPLGQTAAVRIVGSFTRDSGWLNRFVIAPGAVAVDSGAFPFVSRPSNFYSAPLQESLSGVNTNILDSARAQLLWQPMENLTIEPMAMYQLAQQGASDVVDVNGSPTHPQTPAVKGHWQPFDTPEPMQDNFSFGSLQAVYQLPAFSVTSATGFYHHSAVIDQDATEEVAAAYPPTAYSAAAGGLGPVGPGIIGSGSPEQDWERQLTQEIRVTSTAPGPFQWIGATSIKTCIPNLTKTKSTHKGRQSLVRRRSISSLLNPRSSSRTRSSAMCPGASAHTSMWRRDFGTTTTASTEPILKWERSRPMLRLAITCRSEGHSHSRPAEIFRALPRRTTSTTTIWRTFTLPKVSASVEEIFRSQWRMPEPPTTQH